MPALFFPTPDTLRLALASGLVPGGATPAPGRAGFDANGHLWLEPNDLPSRESLTALVRLGVVALGSPGVPTAPVRSWAELLPLKRAAAEGSGTVLFDVPDRRLAQFLSRLRRSDAAVGVRLLPEPNIGRAWLTADTPPLAVLLRADEPDSGVSTFREQAPGVWVARGWRHPLPSHLVAPDGAVLLCAPDRGAVTIAGPVPIPTHEELLLRPRVLPVRGHAPAPRIGIAFRLVERNDRPRDESLWVLTADESEQIEHFAQTADERLLRRFEIATVHAGSESRVLVRRTETDDRVAVLPLFARAFQPHPQLPSLFVPVGHALRPLIRVHELARELGVAGDRVVWVEPADGGIAVHGVASAAFRPLRERVAYEVPPPVAVRAMAPPDEPFPFTRFAIQIDTSIELDPEPEALPAPAPEADPSEPEAEPESGWVSKSVTRMLKWVRRQRERAEAAAPSEPRVAQPEARTAPRSDPHPERVGRKLASADALLHGHDRAARRRELESRLLTDFPRLGADTRAARWAELASVYGATNDQALDAAVCWTNALWECSVPPEGWLEQWAVAECRAAKRVERGADLERWLSEPARPGTGRVVASLAAYFGFQPVPPAEFVAALPRVLALLEHQFDDIPVRAAWLARLAIARSCDGDVLGLARWRDRLLRRLRDRGPGLDLDEPSFLRFRGSATAERFKAASKWLDRMHDPILAWVEGHAGGGLQWAGLDGEGKASSAYAQCLLAWGLGALGERTDSRNWAARARKLLATACGPRADPAAHAFLGDLFLHRIKDAHEGHAPKPHLPTELQERLDRLPEFARYSVDRLREHSRILQPAGAVRAYRWLDLKPFWGSDLLGERLALVGARTDPAELNEEARALLAIAAQRPNTATVPRVTLALLEVAALLDPSLTEAVLALVPPALDGTEAWVQAGRWPDEERPGRVTRFQARMIDGAFAVAPAGVAATLLRYLTREAAAGPLLPAILGAGPRMFRAARRFGLGAEAGALMSVLDPARGEWPDEPITAEKVGLAVGWFAAGDEEAGTRVLDAARDVLFYRTQGDVRKWTDIAVAYAEALGCAPTLALGRLEELFQGQPAHRVTIHASSNCYFTLHPLRLIDAVVRSVVTDEFTIGATVRAWLDEDEFLIRRRIHRDMAALLREHDTGA